MKNLLLIALVLLIGLGVNAQRVLTIDTVKGANTVHFASMLDPKVVQVLCTQIGGTSDGTITLYGTIDGTNWTFINALSPGAAMVLTASPTASITGTDENQITITNGLVASWILHERMYRYYRVTAVGTTGDTTQLDVKWIKWWYGGD